MASIQLLVESEGNRRAIRRMLEDRYEVDTDLPVGEADLYLVDDHTFPAFHDTIRERVTDAQPVFCPVVLVRRPEGRRDVSLPAPGEPDGPLLVDDVVDAPIDRPGLVRRLNTLLVRREQSRELRHYVEQLEQSNRSLEQFAYATSHDLQEPLRMVSSYLRLLDRRYGDRLDEEGEEFLEFAVDGADRMREMIDGLLEYSKVDSGGDPLQRIELGDVVDDVLVDLQMKVREHDAEIEVESLPCVAGDPDQLRQLFQNLLSNAIEYTDGSSPHVMIDAERDGEQWVVTVSDDGIGIDPDDQERIFEVFQRLHSREEYEGTGIGLALCRRIVARHGGDIWVDSEPGEGSTFYVSLPAADATDS